MKPALRIVSVILLAAVLAGCEPTAAKKASLLEKKELLTVDFEQDQTLRYKFVSGRNIELDWGPAKKSSKSQKEAAANKFSESLEFVIAYTPLEVDPFGLTLVRATCQSVKVKRIKGGSQKEAMENLRGKVFTFTVEPTGRIKDYSQLEQLALELGEKAFRSNTDRGRIKETDMIGDFLALQWFLWDSVASIENPAEGVSAGRTWKSKLPVPGPMVMRKARDVTYTLSEVRETEQGRLAIIRSSYAKTDSIPELWPPLPYSGRFQMAGTFGFLRAYKILELSGSGEQIFNLEAGRIEKSTQHYDVLMEATIPMGLDAKPKVTMKQTFTVQLLEE